VTRRGDSVTAILPTNNQNIRKVSLVSCLLLVAFVATACGGNRTSGLTGNGKAPLSEQVAIANCNGERSVAPVTIVLSCTDGNAIVEHARWTMWDATSASGTGVLTTNDCQPTCTGGTFHSRNVDLVAKVPVGRSNHQDFSVLVVTRSHANATAVPMIYQLERGH